MGSVTLVERLLALRAVPAFAEFPDRELAMLAASAELRGFSRGQHILQPSERVSHMTVPLRGGLSVVRDDIPVDVDELAGGIGLLSMLSERPSNLLVRADSDPTLVMIVRRSALSDALEDDFQMSARLLRRMALDMTDLLRAIRSDRRVPEGPDVTLAVSRGGELDLVERLLVLRPSRIFATASLDGVAQFAKLLTEVRRGPGDVLWRERDASNGMLVVVEGTVGCRHAGHDAVTRYGPTGLLGAIDVLSGDRRWATARCETAVRGLWGDAEALLDVLEDNFELTVNLLRFIASRTLELRNAAMQSG